MTLSSGTRLGPYEITGAIGAGGMGEVLRARDMKLSRDVAIKVLPAAFAQDVERVARFRREAQLLATLNHPNIAAIYGLEESGGVLALVLELAEGEDLAARLRRGPIPLREAVAIARQVALGIGEAHDKGIIHRDLKPANIKLTPDGKVKILDFGLAKAYEAEASPILAGDALSAATTEAAPLTEVGIVHGTPAYMSPEQTRGKALDQRSDIWAFGCILYEMLTGRRAFPGSTSSDIFAKILEHDPDWAAVPRGAPTSLQRDLRRCLQKDVRERLRHIRDAVLDGDSVVQGEMPAIAAARPVFRALTVALAVAGWAMAATLLLKPAAPSAAWTRQPVQFEMDAGDPQSLAVSAHGQTIAWVATSADGIVRVRVRSLESTIPRELPGTEGASYPFLAPDGKALAFFAGGELKRIDVATGLVQVMAQTPGVSLGGTWSAAGDIVFSSRYGLQHIAASGGGAREVATLDHTRQENSLRFPLFLPDGRRFVYVARSGRPEKNSAYLGSLDGPPKRIFSTLSKVAFAASGHLLFLRGDTLVAQRFDADTLKLDLDPSTVATAVAPRTLGVGGAFAVSDTGVLVYSHTPPRNPTSLRWFDRAGHDLGALGEPDAYTQFRIAPDGRRAAAAIDDEQAGSRSVWILEPGHIATRITFPGTHDWQPVWSPDGARLAFASYRDGLANIYAKSATGLGNVEPLVLSAVQKDLEDFSPDGRFLAYRDAERNQRGAIVVAELAGARRRIEVRAGENSSEGSARFSGDGRWIAYESDETGRTEVFVQPFPPTGAKWQVSVAGGEEPAWRGDGAELFYLEPRGMLVAVPVDKSASSFTPGGARPLFKIVPRMRFVNSYDVTRDGSRFLVAVSSPGDSASSATVLLNWTGALRK